MVRADWSFTQQEGIMGTEAGHDGSVWVGGSMPATASEVMTIGGAITTGIGVSIALKALGGFGSISAMPVAAAGAVAGTAGLAVTAAGLAGVAVGTLLYEHSETVQDVTAYLAEGIANTPEAFGRLFESINASHALDNARSTIMDTSAAWEGAWSFSPEPGSMLSMNFDFTPVEIIGSLPLDAWLGMA
jgi:hypothetical protein